MTTAPVVRRSPDAPLLAVCLAEVDAFLAVVDYGGFTTAARRLHLSQPGVSARIRRLERALGVVLIDRSVRRLTLTPHGQAFLPEARCVMLALDRGARRARTATVGPARPAPLQGRARPATVA